MINGLSDAEYRRRMYGEEPMTNKPAMTIEEEAMRLALLFDNCEVVLSDITDGLTKALTEAYARGRRDGLEDRCLPDVPVGWVISRLEEINSVNYGNYWFCSLRQISIYPKNNEVGSNEYPDDENKPTTPRAAVLAAILKLKEKEPS